MKRGFDLTIQYCCIYFVILLAVTGNAWGGDIKKVLILPFEVHSEKDLSFLQNGVYDMLSSRLSQAGKVVPVGKEAALNAISGLPGPVNQTAAVKLAKQMGAAYAISGSLTVFGESISTDARFIDATSGSPLVIFNQAGKSHGDVITHVNTFAASVNEKVFGRKQADRSAAPAAGPVPDSRKHPDKIWQESQGGAYLYGTQATEGQAAFSIWKSRKFQGSINGISVGDVDKDGNKEVVFVRHGMIHIYRYAGGKFAKVAELDQKHYNNLLSVDVADINRNGVDEIYVTNLPTTSDALSSFALEWNGRQFEKKMKGANWYYRVVNLPNRGRVLLGQERGDVSDSSGEAHLFRKGVYEMKWENDRLVPDEKLLLPRWVNVYGFTIGDLMNDGGEMVASFSPLDHVRVTDFEGNSEWTSDEPMGGSDTFLELRKLAKHERHQSLDESVGKDKHFLPQRLHITDLDQDGKKELVVVNNHDVTGSFLPQTRFYKSGHIQCLEWDAIGMRMKWKTQKTGYISDYVIADLNNDGIDEVAFSVVLKSGAVIQKARSYIASMTLKPPKKP